MKSVGQQLQEARLAKNWTPELASRETKIKADRVRDLESDNYAHFSSPTYARGFVRTYARALGLDEYRILRQLDNKLPEDDNASFAPDNGAMPYVPEPTTQALHVSSAPRTGLYVVSGLGCAVALIIAFVMLQAYRAGELQRYFASGADHSAPAQTAVTAGPEAAPHATALDPNDTTHAAKAIPVDLNHLSPDDAAASTATPVNNAAPVAPIVNNIPVATGGTPPRAIAVDLAHPDQVPAAPPAAEHSEQTPAQMTAATPANENPSSDSSAHAPLKALPVDPSELVAANQSAPEGPINPATASESTDAGGSTPEPAHAAAPVSSAPKTLVLTATHDSFIRVTSLDHPAQEVLYASVLRSGQSVEFDGRKFSVNVGVPSAVAIMLDGANYLPHGEGDTPQTFNLESHQP